MDENKTLFWALPKLYPEQKIMCVEINPPHHANFKDEMYVNCSIYGNITIKLFKTKDELEKTLKQEHDKKFKELSDKISELFQEQLKLSSHKFLYHNEQ